MNREIIAVVGPIASGKGTIIDYLVALGYTKISLSEIVREEAKKIGLEFTRENLQNVGDSLRHEFGNDYLAKKVSERILLLRKENSDCKLVIDSIRNPSELKYFKNIFKIYVIGTIASPEMRFTFVKHRGRRGDPMSWEEFEKLEKRDRGLGQEAHGQQVDAVIKMADVILHPTGKQEDLINQLQSVLH